MTLTVYHQLGLDKVSGQQAFTQRILEKVQLPPLFEPLRPVYAEVIHGILVDELIFCDYSHPQSYTTPARGERIYEIEQKIPDLLHGITQHIPEKIFTDLPEDAFLYEVVDVQQLMDVIYNLIYAVMWTDKQKDQPPHTWWLFMFTRGAVEAIATRYGGTKKPSPSFTRHLSPKQYVDDCCPPGFRPLFYMRLPAVMPPAPEIEPDLAFSGIWVIAPQGKGKSTLLRSLIEPRLHEECSIIVFDSKAAMTRGGEQSLSDSYRYLKLPKQTVTIDPHANLSMNPMRLGTHSVSTLMYLFGCLGADFTPMQSVLLRHCIHLCTLIPDANMTTFRSVIAYGTEKYPEALQLLDEEDQDFWQLEYKKTYGKTIQELLWRLNLLRPSGSFLRTMFNAPTTKVDIAKLMDTNTFTIIGNSTALLDPIQGEFFSRMILTMILAAAEQRARLPDSKKLPCYVIIDEAQTVIAREAGVADIIQRCRSQKISLLCAHHSLSQLENDKVRSALADCAIRYANVDSDGPALAASFNVDADYMRNLPVGEFVLSLRGAPTTRVKIEKPDLSNYRTLTTAELTARDAFMQQTYHYTPAVPAPKTTDPQPLAGPVINVLPTED